MTNSSSASSVSKCGQSSLFHLAREQYSKVPEGGGEEEEAGKLAKTNKGFKI